MDFCDNKNEKSLLYEEAFFDSQAQKYPFESFRCWNGRLINLTLHWDRFVKSCDLLGLTAPNKETFFEIAHHLALEHGDEFRFRIDMHPDGTLSGSAREFVVDESLFSGVCAQTVFFERSFVNAKYDSPMYRYFYDQQPEGIWETLFVSSQGYITEGSRTNIAFLSGETIVLPNKDDCLDGIMIQSLLSGGDFEVQRKDIEASSIKTFDGSVLTNSLYGVVPLKKIDAISFEKSHLLREMLWNPSVFN